MGRSADLHVELVEPERVLGARFGAKIWSGQVAALILGERISWEAGEGGSVLLAEFEKSQLAQDDFMFTDDRQVIQPTSADAETVTAVKFAKDEGGNRRPLHRR
jgi:hypothetical protein